MNDQIEGTKQEKELWRYSQSSNKTKPPIFPNAHSELMKKAKTTRERQGEMIQSHKESFRETEGEKRRDQGPNSYEKVKKWRKIENKDILKNKKQ